MTDLIACLDENGSSHVLSLVKNNDWNKVFLITNGLCRNFNCEKKVDFIVVDFTKPVFEVIERIKRDLEGKLGFDVALNLVSGNGKEHMAILAALLKLGVGIRLIAVTKDGIKEL